MKQATIIFVRHGESEGNVAHVINDNPERVVNLTERGRAQAEMAAQALRGQRFTHAYASEFPRAQQTAEILLRYQSCELNIDPRVNERRSGMDGLSVNVFRDLVRPDPLRVKPPKGESFAEQIERLRGFLEEIVRRHPAGRVLVVSHEDPILAALAAAGRDPEDAARGGIGNCEWVELVWRAG